MLAAQASSPVPDFESALQTHVGRAAKFFENRPTHRIVELKMRHLPLPPLPSKALQALGQ